MADHLADQDGSVFPDQFVEQRWRSHWCDRCYQPDEAERRVLGKGDGCPIFARASLGEVPAEWKQGSASSAVMLYSCIEHLDRPPVHRRPRAKATGVQLEMFSEPDREERFLVPVDSWPDYAAITRDTTKPPGAA
jgi:hypothetical protein